ncbi:uncharacterized protein LY79DRAFT_543018 [Colletotrichum navitas]|uniref:Uncharacterized protein n=1 Tax=Colletotrichum navitas TaxID=681940 RepID=A0AAD8Q6L3_9PEZI|nr:uncharacterized protein LY79DRAFT_543018 [Colletotrichum navitas]KAK1596880.1 hypothetical protein LY79DRAFT_543018 [Colletotrichum navitas]
MPGSDCGTLRTPSSCYRSNTYEGEMKEERHEDGGLSTGSVYPRPTISPATYTWQPPLGSLCSQMPRGRGATIQPQPQVRLKQVDMGTTRTMSTLALRLTFFAILKGREERMSAVHLDSGAARAVEQTLSGPRSCATSPPTSLMVAKVPGRR